jgi:hypothetical protein
MDRGESLMEILAVYPELVDQLKPLLMTAMLSRALPPPVPGFTALRLGKNELLAEMASMQSEGAFLEPKPIQPARDTLLDRLAGSLQQLQPAYRVAMLSLVVIMAGGFFTLSASASGMADNVLQTIFYSFEQVGDLLMVNPRSGTPGGENTIFTGNYGLPASPQDYAGDYKVLNLGDGEDKTGTGGAVDPASLETRVYTIPSFPDGESGLLELPGEEIIDEKDLEKEEKEDEKDLEKEEKEDEKEADKADKEADKDEKEADKEEDKAEKDAEKDEKKDDKDKD